MKELLEPKPPPFRSALQSPPSGGPRRLREKEKLRAVGKDAPPGFSFLVPVPDAAAPDTLAPRCALPLDPRASRAGRVYAEFG